MPQQLNRVPSGLLSLFQIKSLGSNPSLLADAITGTYETSNHYYAALGIRLARASSSAVTGADFAARHAIIDVPENEIWVVRGITTENTVTASAASEWAHFTPILQPSSDPNEVIPLASTWVKDNFGTGLNTNRVSSIFFDNPLFVRGGASIWSALQNWNGVNAEYEVITKCLHYVLEK